MPQPFYTPQLPLLVGFTPDNLPGMNTHVKKTLAWGVHFYTGLGLVAIAGITVALVDGQPAGMRWAFLLMFIATLVDATDGTLARAIKVKEVLPGFDGRRLDDLIDFQTYTTLPLFLIWRANLLDDAMQPWLLVPLFASAYGFCQVAAKTDDGYFLGFPSYWNIVAFYLYVLQMPAWLALGIILFLSLLTFLPALYLYPTHHGWLNRLTNYLGAPWGVLLVWIVWRLPSERIDGQNADDTTRLLALVSLAFPIYYLVVSWYVTVKIHRRKRRRQREKELGLHVPA
jgi:phosphatidylcholine synthase